MRLSLLPSEQAALLPFSRCLLSVQPRSSPIMNWACQEPMLIECQRAAADVTAILHDEP